MRFLVIATLTLAACEGFSQGKTLSVEQAIELALKNNAGIKASGFELEAQKQLQKTSFDLPKTDITLLYGQNNSYPKNDNNIMISQSIPFSSLGSQSSLHRARVRSDELEKSVTENTVVYQIRQAYYQLVFTHEHHKLLLREDSMYEGFLRSASLRYKTGETNLLEQTTVEMQWSELKNQLRQNEAEITTLRIQLGVLMNSGSLPEIIVSPLMALPWENLPDTNGYKTNPSLIYMRQQIEVAHREKKLQAAKFAPDLLVGFFSQTLIGGPSSETGPPATSNDRFTGFQVGISLPLWFVPHQARIRSAEFNKKAAESNFQYHQSSLQGQLRQAIQQAIVKKNNLDYYNASGLPNSDRILKQSQAAFKHGEISSAEYLAGVKSAMSIQEGYMRAVNDYNKSILYIEYLTGNK